MHLDFSRFTEAKAREWVDAKPWRVYKMDIQNHSLLYVAAKNFSLAFMVYLMDVKGADPRSRNGTRGESILHAVSSVEKVNALLERGVNPTAKNVDWETPLMLCADNGNSQCVARYLQDPRVRASLNVAKTRLGGFTTLHCACRRRGAAVSALDCTRVLELLLEAGANPNALNTWGRKPLDILKSSYPTNYAAHALLNPDIFQAHQHALFLVKVRRFVSAETKNRLPAWAATRERQNEPLPHVALAVASPVKNEDEEGAEKRRATLAWVVGLEGQTGAGAEPLPGGVFVKVMDFLMVE